jgi:hypothetical protein
VPIGNELRRRDLLDRQRATGVADRVDRDVVRESGRQAAEDDVASPGGLSPSIAAQNDTVPSPSRFLVGRLILIAGRLACRAT